MRAPMQGCLSDFLGMALMQLREEACNVTSRAKECESWLYWAVKKHKAESKLGRGFLENWGFHPL